MQMPGSIAAANLPCDDRPSDAAFGHVVFGRNATILRPLKDPPGMPTEDVLTLLESRILGLSVDHLTTAASDSTIRKSSDALLLRCSDAEVGQDRASGVDLPITYPTSLRKPNSSAEIPSFEFCFLSKLYP